MEFSGKVCLITGAAGGLGKAIAQAFLQAGAAVSICDINEERLVKTTEEFSAAHSNRILSSCIDITDDNAVEDLVETTVDRFGRLDVLVNNAGIVDRYDPVGTLPRPLWDKVVAVNLTAPYVFSKLAVQRMLSQTPSGGVIINISSVAGVKGSAAGAAYVATKHGIIGLTKNTAAVYNKKNIRCVVILPGGMDTPIRETLNISNQEAWDITMKAAAVEPSISDVDDVAKCVLFYSSAHAKCCNGAVVTTDGGWLAF